MVKSKPLMEKSKKTFNHIKIHTQYSICEGAIKIDELSKYCKDNKLKRLECQIRQICVDLEFQNKFQNQNSAYNGSQINFKFNDKLDHYLLLLK